MLKRMKAVFGKGQDQGFTLIEMLIVILIIGILAAVAAPLYLGYVRDARTAEAKSVAGALWTSVQAQGVAQCNSAVQVSAGYGRAGLPGGTTQDLRWTTSGGTNTLTVDCSTGSLSASAQNLFTLQGQKADNTGISVTLTYTTAQSPASQLLCDTGSGPQPC
jgi:prepilin-type N-terminal cleavage/methylation domain-containing protein